MKLVQVNYAFDPRLRDPDAIREIVVRLYRTDVLTYHKRPLNAVDAQFNVPYLMAVALTRGKVELADLTDLELRARRVVERAALALQGSLLVRHAPDAVADAFCATRLAGDGGRAFGTLPPGTDLDAIIERAWPRA